MQGLFSAKSWKADDLLSVEYLVRMLLVEKNLHQYPRKLFLHSGSVNHGLQNFPSGLIRCSTFSAMAFSNRTQLNFFHPQELMLLSG